MRNSGQSDLLRHIQELLIKLGELYGILKSAGLPSTNSSQSIVGSLDSLKKCCITSVLLAQKTILYGKYSIVYGH